jgi:osmotically-inducible protein OsmY
MKSTLTLSFAALAAAASMAAGAVVVTQAPTWRAESDYKFSEQPVASAVAGTPDNEAALVNQVVDALNQDGSFKLAKITVSAYQGLVTLTGTTATSSDAKRAVDIASSKAGTGNVVSVLQPGRISYPTAAEQDQRKAKAQEAAASEQG